MQHEPAEKRTYRYFPIWTEQLADNIVSRLVSLPSSEFTLAISRVSFCLKYSLCPYLNTQWATQGASKLVGI